MAKKKRRRQQRRTAAVVEVSSKASRRLGGMAFLAFVVGVAVLVGILSTRNGRTEPLQPRHHNASPPAAPQRDPEAAVEQQHGIEVWYEHVLTTSVAGDTRGEELAAFFRDHAIFSQLIGNGATRGLVSGTSPDELLRQRHDPLTFEVTPSSLEERQANGLQVMASWQWEPGRNELFVPRIKTFTDPWAGIVFAHEISHAYDAVTGNEPRGLPPNDARFLDGEIRAYQLEFRLLDRLTNGRLRTSLGAIVAQHSEDIGQQSWFMPDDTEIASLEALFPEARSNEERATRLGSYVIQLNFLLNERLGGGVNGQRAIIQRTMS